MMLFFAVVALTSLLTYALIQTGLERRDRAVAMRRLAGPATAKQERRRVAKSLLIEQDDAARGQLAKHLLEKLKLKPAAERLLETAALKWGAPGLLHRSIALFVAGFLGVTLATGNSLPLAALAAGAVLGLVPLWYVRRKAGSRIRQFEEQFPDCLEFISRSMRAGHAFSVALEMVQHEFSD